MPSFAELITEARARLKMNQAVLARKAGYNPSYFSQIENGRRLVDAEFAVRIAKILKLDPTEALLAATRDRLPAAMRRYLPEKIPRQNPDALRGAVREFQSQDFDFEVGHSLWRVSCDWDGNLKMSRTAEDCRPRFSDRPIFDVEFQERVFAANEGAQTRPLRVHRAPPKLKYRIESESSDDWLHYRLVFEDGWHRKRQPRHDSLTYSLDSYQPGALYLDSDEFMKRISKTGTRVLAKGCFTVYVRHFIKRLTVRFELPRGCNPELWQSWVWWGHGPLTATMRDIGGRACRKMDFSFKGNRAQLEVSEPIAGYSYAILWTPIDRQRYLEAKQADLTRTRTRKRTTKR